MREEKRNKLLDKLDYSFRMREMTSDKAEEWEKHYEYGLNALDQAYQYGLQQGVEMAIGNFPKWKKLNKRDFELDDMIQKRKKEMLQPLYLT